MDVSQAVRPFLSEKSRVPSRSLWLRYIGTCAVRARFATGDYAQLECSTKILVLPVVFISATASGNAILQPHPTVYLWRYLSNQDHAE